MPSLRQKVTTYFRQLSFISEPRDGPRTSPRKADDDGNFIIKYLEGRMDRIFVDGPEIYNGEEPTDLPVLPVGAYSTGPGTITAACTGPDDGLTGIKRSKLHLSASYADDIDFIDTIQDNGDSLEVRRSINIGSSNARVHTKFNRFGGGGGGGGRKLSSTATTPTSDQNANKTLTTTSTLASGIGGGGMRSRKNSKTGIATLLPPHKATEGIAAAATNTVATTTTITPTISVNKGSTMKADGSNANRATTIVVSMVSSPKMKLPPLDAAADQNNRNILNAKTAETSIERSKDMAITNGLNIDAASTLKLMGGDTTARLLHEAVSNQGTMAACNGDLHAGESGGGAPLADPIAGVTNWKMENESAYGISVSLYENNMLTKEPMGNPIADCYGMVVRGDVAAMALADGVNWGDGARLAARSAVHGCLDYLDRAVFGVSAESRATSTQEVFVSLLRALWEGHACILEVGGALSTLTIAIVLPLSRQDSGVAVTATATAVATDDVHCNNKYVVCACNVGDSLGYVYSKRSGVREFTQASHDITSMRDMRDALGALGPADGNKPELGNLTFSMTTIERGDIVFLTSDGISDNFDPVVGKFAEAWTPSVKLMPSNVGLPQQNALASKRQNKSASAIYARLHRNDQMTVVPVSRTKKPPANGSTAPSRPKYIRSQTVIEPRRLSAGGGGANGPQPCDPLAAAFPAKIPKSMAGLPLVTGPQRHALTLHRLEDLLSYGINGTLSPCLSARRLCHLLIDFARMITSARRKTLEQRELFYKLSTGPDGKRREIQLTRIQHRGVRKRIVDSSAFASLPGKLDHATVVAYTVGGTSTSPPVALQSQEFQETNF